MPSELWRATKSLATNGRTRRSHHRIVAAKQTNNGISNAQPPRITSENLPAGLCGEDSAAWTDGQVAPSPMTAWITDSSPNGPFPPTQESLIQTSHESSTDVQSKDRTHHYGPLEFCALGPASGSRSSCCARPFRCKATHL